MRTLLSLAMIFCLIACSSAGGSLVPIRATGDITGDSAGPQVFIAGIPMNELVKVHGHVKYTVQPVPPYVTLDGDYTIIVEPNVGREAEAKQCLERGDMLIRREGKPAALNAPGSIRTFKAMESALREYQIRKSIIVAPPAPTPEVQKSGTIPPPMPVTEALAEPPCFGLTCSIPTTK